MLRDVNRKPLAFCMRRYACKKYKIDVNGLTIRSPLLFVRGVACVKSIRYMLRDVN
jgi:hypothetical protein